MNAANCKSSALARPLLILDLDETLVLSVEKPLERPADFRLKDYHVYFRPHLKLFLARVQAVYDVAVWSAGGSGYVEPTVAHLFQELAAPVFVWSFPRCTRKFDHESHEEYYIKDLKKVYKKGFARERMLIVDDLERNCLRNYGSAVYIRAFDGSEGDEELLHLAAYLEALAPQPNFRAVEKRYWRKRGSNA